VGEAGAPTTERKKDMSNEMCHPTENHMEEGVDNRAHRWWQNGEKLARSYCSLRMEKMEIDNTLRLSKDEVWPESRRALPFGSFVGVRALRDGLPLEVEWR
jgi:hypothetical protein